MAGLVDACLAPVSASFYFNKLALLYSALNKTHDTGTLRKERVVPSTANILARMEVCTTLANNDIASQH